MLPRQPFYFLRHGETDWNKARRLQGLTDVPLNANGEAQAELARAAVAGLALKSIAVSSLSRARRTAEIVNRDLGLTMTHFDSLREFDVGPYEGSTDGSWIDDWLKDQVIDGPETFIAFRERVRAGMIAALRLDHPVLVVAHGGVFWALQRLLGFAELAHIPNAVVAHFTPPIREDETWRVKLV